jgi:hypothetical protein
MLNNSPNPPVSSPTTTLPGLSSIANIVGIIFTLTIWLSVSPIALVSAAIIVGRSTAIVTFAHRIVNRNVNAFQGKCRLDPCVAFPLAGSAFLVVVELQHSFQHIHQAVNAPSDGVGQGRDVYHAINQGLEGLGISGNDLLGQVGLGLND